MIRRYGIIVPWCNTVVEDELPFLISPSIRLHWTRIRPSHLPADPHDESYLDDMVRFLPDAAAQFDGINLEGIILACTSASFAHAPLDFGGRRVMTTFGCLCWYALSLQYKALYLIAPYSQLTVQRERGALEQAGIRITATRRIISELPFREIPEAAIFSVVESSLEAGADAILLSCTGLYTLRLVQNLRQEFPNVPIASSVTSIGAFLISDRSQSDAGDSVRSAACHTQ